MSASRIGLVAGPLLFALLVWGWRSDVVGVVAGVTAWMAVWWMTEAIPIPATSLLPMVLLPIGAGARFPLDRVAGNYANGSVFLFFGGFLIAIGMERTGLHRRIALHLVRRVGTSPRRLVLGFMVATAFLSMWISNTATTLMMLPIGIAVVDQVRGRGRFATALMLGIAYGASIGGLGTLIGTPPNLSFQRQFKILFKDAPAVSFAAWMGLAVPVVLTFLPATWWILVRRLPRGSGDGAHTIDEAIAALGPMRRSEERVLLVFVLTALLWVSRPAWGAALHCFLPLHAADDGVVAMAMGLSLFLVPGDKGAVLGWETVLEKMPWGILLLFGGGFALADAIRHSGLSAEIGRSSGFLAGAAPVLVMAGCAFGVTFLTEVTSNTATAEILLPLVAGVATGAAGIDPRIMMLPVTLAASCAFMLPVATPPNAVVFGSGHVRMRDMVRAGFAVNLLGIVLVALACWLLGPLCFGIDYDAGLPPWVKR